MMVLALLAGMCILAAVLFLQTGALVEMFEQLKQVRTYLDLTDRVSPLRLGSWVGGRASAVGLPEGVDQMNGGVVLFLSNKCETCRIVAGGLRGEVPDGLWVVVVPVISGDPMDFVEEFGLSGPRVMIDEPQGVAWTLGLDVTPAAVVIEGGRMTRAHTVPTSRQLNVALEDALRYGRTVVGHLGGEAAVQSAMLAGG